MVEICLTGPPTDTTAGEDPCPNLFYTMHDLFFLTFIDLFFILDLFQFFYHITWHVIIFFFLFLFYLYQFFTPIRKINVDIKLNM